MFNTILYPTDFSDASRKALQYITRLKEVGTRRVVVLHVVDERDIRNIARFGQIPDTLTTLREMMENQARDKMEKTEANLKAAGFEVKSIITHGIPFKEILNVEEQEDISVVVLGSHGRSNIAEMLLGSVSEKVVQKSKRPVLIVKRDR